jgi:type I restriction enzyme M protein
MKNISIKKNQNKLRPEDIEKIAFTYRNKQVIPKYSELVSKADLAAEEYNLNIRRFVDNAPPAEPHDVHAHLQGGVPESEVNALQSVFSSYQGLQEKLFVKLKDGYLKFTDVISQKEELKKLFDESAEIKNAHAQYTEAINQWWQLQLPVIEKLNDSSINAFDLYHQFSKTLTEKLNALTILDEFKSRGSFASYWNSIYTDIKSVDASGWNAELIPDDEILESQFPEVLKELRSNEARKEELEAMFAEVNELEEGVWTEEDYEVWQKDELKEHKEAIKALKGERKEADREFKNIKKRITANEKALKQNPALAAEIETLKTEAEKYTNELTRLDALIAADEERIAKHTTLEEELKQCKKVIKEIKDKKQNLVEQARLLITPEEAKELILKRWQTVLHQSINGYLETHSRQLLIAIEQLHSKYTTPLYSILEARETETQLLNTFLMELGYE